MRLTDIDVEGVIFDIIVIGTLAMMVFVVVAPVPKNCKITGITKVQSFILVGSVIVPYTFEQPIYNCTKTEPKQKT